MAKISSYRVCVPLVDYVKCLDCIEHLYEIDKNNIYALIIECCVYQFHLGGIDEKLFRKLNNINDDNKKTMSIIKYIMSWYYRDNDEKNMISLLEESISLYDRYVSSYEKLGKVCIKQGNIIEGKKLIRKALNNIELIYDKDSIVDFTDFNEYIAENVIGIHLSSFNKERIEKIYNNC
ncbi:tetratricopeptide repeat protein [Clostridium saccharoperbutylacetonicum]|uniref:tetratricopeptide repeat protein n=1 Tax=Clostridium saccharoperbutylacetonicum TaxID=36745 RepID=UPI001FA6ABFF|nr:hypothetical protein [Clostridium saccharoperbutylacetonicum]